MEDWLKIFYTECCNQFCQNHANLLRCIELTGLFTCTACKLAYQVFVGIAQEIEFGMFQRCCSSCFFGRLTFR